MSTTIDSLDIQITTSAGQSAANIEKLANALEKLRANSKLTTVTNNLGKLKNALDGLQSSSGAISSLGKLSQAMQGLASLPNLTGLKSAINALKKIPDVMNGLDASKLEEFRKKMQKLADALAPVATRINTISQGFSRLPSRISSAISATNRMATANNNAARSFDMSSVSMMATISNYGTLIAVLNQVIQVMAKVMDQAMGWDGIQFRFGRAFGEDAEETYEYIQKVNEALGINVQEFMQYSSMYGSLLSGFGLSQDKVTTISVGLSELTYDLWAANNDVVKRYEDVATAVKSAITGEIEPIRNLGIPMTEASLQEFIDKTELAGVSIEKLTEAQKSEVRYAAMVNAAMNQGIVGTYAREMITAEGAVRSLSQSFKGLVQALGSLFIPLLQLVIPYVTAFVELLTLAVHKIASIFNIPIQKIDWSKTAKGVGGIAEGAKDATKGLDSASKAAKKLKQYTMGFDELNVISPDTGSDTGDLGAGGVGGSGFGNGLDLDTLWDDSVLEDVTRKVDEIKQKILDFVDKWKWAFALAGAAMTAFAGHKMWKMFASSKFGEAIIGWVKNFASGLKMLTKGNISLKTFLSGITGGTTTQNFMASAKDLVLRFGNAVITAFKNLPTMLVNAIKAIPGWGWIIAAIAAVLTLAIVDYDFTDIGYKIGNAIGKALAKIGEWLGAAGEWIVSVGKSILGGIEAAWKWVKDEFDIKNIFDFILVMFNPMTWVKEIIPKMIEIGLEVLPGLWQGIKNGWNNFWGNIKEFIDGFIQGFKDGLGINSPSKVFAEIGMWIIQGLLNGISEKWEAVKRWYNTTVAPKFTKAYWRNVYDTVVAATKEKLEEVKKQISDKWSSITNWYNQTVAPKLTTEYWKTKFDGIKSGLKAKLDEAWDAVKDFFSVEKWKSIVEDAVKAIKNNFTMPSLPKIKLDVTWDTNVGPLKKAVYEALGLSGWPSLKWTAYATGGFPKMGEAFIAREAGPELVGRIGNKSAVANNDQIITAVSQGVYSAVVSAMSETQGNSGGTQPVVVYLDGKQIYSNVKRTESRRGIDLMGNQVGYVY